MSKDEKAMSGAYALACGAIEAGVSLVTGYPGSPTTAVVNEILALTTASDLQVEWTSNEKVAIEMAFGGSLAGAPHAPTCSRMTAWRLCGISSSIERV